MDVRLLINIRVILAFGVSYLAKFGIAFLLEQAMACD